MMCPSLAACILAALRAGASSLFLLWHSQQQGMLGVGTSSWLKVAGVSVTITIY